MIAILTHLIRIIIFKRYLFLN